MGNAKAENSMMQAEQTGEKEIRDRFEGETFLGIEFGSTRIKAVLTDGRGTPLASGGHAWENRYENHLWTYSLEDIFGGMQDCYNDLAGDIKGKIRGNPDVGPGNGIQRHDARLHGF